MKPRIITAAERAARRKGLGDRVADVIEGAISPLPAKIRTKAKSCAGCRARKNWLNRIGRAFTRLISTKRP